jgi:hypothetical protein
MSGSAERPKKTHWYRFSQGMNFADARSRGAGGLPSRETGVSFAE